MYFFFHLLAGIIIGCLAGELLHDRRWIIPCAAGAVLPDIIDKFIGHIIFPQTIGYGRIYAHTLLITFIIIVLGFAIWEVKSDPGVFALGIGLLSHGILDQMWKQPANWFFPLFGPFQGKLPADYFMTLVIQELSNPFELTIIFLIIAGLALAACRHKLKPVYSRYREVIAGIAVAASFLFCILAGTLIGQGIFGNALIEIEKGTPEEQVIGGVVLALAAYVLWRWQERWNA